VLLEGRVGIVSGVGGGIGRATALAFAREGADVVLAARSEHVLREVAAEVENLGRRALWLQTDITVPEQCEQLAAATHSAFGRIDVLVNNAFSAKPVVQFTDGKVDDWRLPMEVNFWGSLNLTHAVVPYMRELRSGRVVMTSMLYRHASEGYGPYASSKAALHAACRVLARELGPSGIRVNTVAAGDTEGPNFERSSVEIGQREGLDTETVRARRTAAKALGYIPSADEVAAAILFFASDLGSAATGTFLPVNGGQNFE
jgi:NAD(P)-dependent dehydrogenase (short-subunit alcohol dehydrogenase family)